MGKEASKGLGCGVMAVVLIGGALLLGACITAPPLGGGATVVALGLYLVLRKQEKIEERLDDLDAERRGDHDEYP